MANILIAGCGEIGTALGLKLVSAGHQVWGLRRTSNLLPEAIKPLLGDLLHCDAIQLPNELHYVFYTAAANMFSDTCYYNTYVLGLKKLLAKLHQIQQSLQHFFFVSSTSVYGQAQGEWVDENSLTEPVHFAGKRILEAEQVLAADTYPFTTIRFAGIYGVGRDHLIHEVLQPQEDFSIPCIYTNRIHQDDCVNVLIHLLNLKQREQLYLAVDCEPVLKSTVMTWLAEQLGIVLPESSIANELELHPLRGNKRCSNQRLLASGYQFTYPSYREGYAQILKAQNRI